jgi:hypothetical protein
MAEEEQKIRMQDASDKTGDAAPQEDAYAGITSEDPPKETQRSAGTFRLVPSSPIVRYIY